MKKKKTYHHGDLKNVLIKEAFSLIEETNGWEFSMRTLSRRANVSHMAAYSHFEDKIDLLAHVAAEGFRRLATAACRAASRKAEAPREALKAIGIAYITHGAKHPAIYKLMFGPTLSGGAPEFLAVAGDRCFDVLRETVAACARPYELTSHQLHVHSMAAWSMVHGITLLMIDRPASTLDRMGRSERVIRQVANDILESTSIVPSLDELKSKSRD